MTAETQELLARVRALPAMERATILEQLLDDLSDEAPPQADVPDAWGRVVRERMREYDAAPGRTSSWEAVRDAARRR